MSVALKSMIFRNPNELKVFAETPANNVTTIVDIVIDGSNRYVLFYL